jgi:hypothetical protein
MADRPVEAALTAAVVLGLAAVLVLRRHRGRGAAVLAEGACPACLALRLWTTPAAGAGDRLG